MSGYQAKSRDVVWKQVSAIYSTIAAEGLQYAEPPASFGTDGQRIRTPERILDGRVATCLDLAMLFASCLEQAGLRSIILMKEGHAWIGVWLHETCFPDALVDDVLSVRKRVETGELLVFEATGVAHHHSLRPSLRLAAEQGLAHLHEEGSFRYVVDIHRARELQIKPLPSKGAPVRGVTVLNEQPAGIEPTPILPPLDPEALGPIDLPDTDTPEGRLANWKARLLDLTLRNRLLNFKSTKTTVQIVAPDLGAIEDIVAEGGDFRLRPLPDLMAGRDPRMAAVHEHRGGRAPLDDMATQALGNHELIARVGTKELLDDHLLAIYSAARTGLEEGGANTLYLALGLLRWAETEQAETTHLAPILLVPVTLQRQSVRSGYVLSRHDDETILNPTLLQYLRTAFELRLPSLDVLPTDDKGVDVPKVLQTIRMAVRDIKKWEVLDQAHLGIFSFTKYLMWKDLQDRSEQLKGSPVVKHLIENPGKAIALDPFEEPTEGLDNAYRPQDIFAPMLADSSQLKAICMVDAGRDLVLEGPPGTGKSQTITNLIAHSLAKGKRVLFVSEKMAALEVVHRRLTDIGLGPFCLELHSSKAKKAQVLEQLGQALAVTGGKTEGDWTREAERLADLRTELNEFVSALHRAHPNGLTAFDAIGTCIQHDNESPSPLSWPNSRAHDRASLDALRELARKMPPIGSGLGKIEGHALGEIGHSDWSPSWQDEVMAAVEGLSAATSRLRDCAKALEPAFGAMASDFGLDSFEIVDRLADALLAAPRVPPGLVRQADDAATRAHLRSLATHGRARQSHWSRMGAGWDPTVAKLNAAELQAEWTQAQGTWWPKSWWTKRALAKRLAAFRSSRARPTDAEIDLALSALDDVNEEDLVLRSMQAQAEALLDDSFAGLQTDWNAVEQHEKWATEFATAASSFDTGDRNLDQTLKQAALTLATSQPASLLPTGSIGRALLVFRDAHREFRAQLAATEKATGALHALAGPSHAPGAPQRILATLESWKSARRQLQAWCQWRKVRAAAIAAGLQGLVTSIEAGRIPLAHAEEHFEHSYRHWWLKKVIDEDAVLREFSSADHERKIREFRQTDERFQRLTQQYVAAILARGIPSSTAVVASADSEMGRLRRELQKQRRQLPVRQLVRGLPTLLPKLKPCLLMSPLSVAQYLEASHTVFDLVVFDEASQIPVWDAVGAIARGRQLIVVGDPKQLPPTNFFTRSIDSDHDATSDEQVEELESILDECIGIGMNRSSLRWHYRSRHESLITFSNVHYYDSRLVTFPSPVTDDVAVRFEAVAGSYDRGGSRTNRAEAEAIVKAIEAHFSSAKGRDSSLGVVTFNQPQQDLIETLLDARRRANSNLDRFIAASSHEPLFIKNLENVQGDERDIIFFSITYGPDVAGKMTMNFGPLNGEGGHRRLNVAISRAREGVVIFSTLKPEQIDLARVRAAGVRDLKHYLEFALRGPRSIIEERTVSGLDAESPFEEAVMRALREQQWVVHPQVGCSGYRIDLAVVDPRAPGRYLIGIECDGRTYHSGATARDRDRLRQKILEDLGWKIHRIWSTNWWLDAEGEIAKLHARLVALTSEEGIDADPPEQGKSERSSNLEEGAVAEDDGAVEPGSPVESSRPDRVYVSTKLQPGNAEAFYEARSSRALIACLEEVIATEGPVCESILHRRVARSWGLERTGSRIVERLRSLTPRSIRQTRDSEHTFLWPKGTDPSTWTDFRVAGDGDESRRHVAEVCLQEIERLIAFVLDQAGAAPPSDIARSVCKLLGMARTPTDAEARVTLVLARLVDGGSVVDDGGYIRVSDRA
jgi:very-short-patch-repair endonuclease